MKTKIIKMTLVSLLASSSLFASDITLDSFGLNLGKSYSDYSQKNNTGEIVLGNEPDKSFNTFEVFVSFDSITQVCKENNIKPYLSYTYSNNDDLKHQYILLGGNKYFEYDTFTPYVGVLIGYGQVDWKYDPLNNSTRINKDANSLMAGLNLGIDIPLNDTFAFNLNSKVLYHNYETDLESQIASTTIEHKLTSSLMVGIKYSF